MILSLFTGDLHIWYSNFAVFLFPKAMNQVSRLPRYGASDAHLDPHKIRVRTPYHNSASSILLQIIGGVKSFFRESSGIKRA